VVVSVLADTDPALRDRKSTHLRQRWWRVNLVSAIEGSERWGPEWMFADGACEADRSVIPALATDEWFAARQGLCEEQSEIPGFARGDEEDDPLRPVLSAERVLQEVLGGLVTRRVTGAVADIHAVGRLLHRPDYLRMAVADDA
jgi:hypothetical protein